MKVCWEDSGIFLKFIHQFLMKPKKRHLSIIQNVYIIGGTRRTSGMIEKIAFLTLMTDRKM